MFCCLGFSFTTAVKPVSYYTYFSSAVNISLHSTFEMSAGLKFLWNENLFRSIICILLKLAAAHINSKANV